MPRVRLHTKPRSRENGNVWSFEYDVPANFTRANRVFMTLDIDTADYEDPSFLLECRVYRWDGGAFEFWKGFKWSGGRNIDPDTGENVIPEYNMGITAFVGRRIRVEVIGAQGRRIGFILDTFLP